MKPIIYVRHGSTPYDSDVEKIQSWDDSQPVTAAGKRESVRVAQRLSKLPIAAIVSSHLSRAKTTADAIGKAAGVPVETTDKLAPWKKGKFTGKNVKDVKGELDAYQNDKPDEKIPGGESFNDYLGRLKAGVEHVRGLQRANPDGHVVAVTHSTDLLALPHIHSAGEEDIPTSGAPKPGSAVTVKTRQGKTSLEPI
ncbi:MAG TPA: histidine phosphatase family protein [Candidatus Acidoferrum sp.]|nr:histidine phosphatase family protein [Candidatus Acidoferrum sp.]